jgi:hypothetical protein
MVGKKISIIVPVFEKKENFIIFYESTKKNILKNDNIEFIFVDDGNNYNLEEIINLEINKYRLVKNTKNLGYGASIKKGVVASDNDIIGIIDCDNSYDLDHLIILFSNFEEANCDMIVGKRIFKYRDNYLKILFRKTINILSTLIFNYKVEDINSGLRIFYKADFIKDRNIYSDKFSLSSTQTLCTISRNKIINYVDTNYFKRDGVSKISVFMDPFRFLYLIFKVFLIFSPMKFFGTIGIFFIIISFLILILSLFFLVNILDVTFLILFISGLNFIFFGLIAEIIKIYNNKD